MEDHGSTTTVLSASEALPRFATAAKVLAVARGYGPVSTTWGGVVEGSAAEQAPVRRFLAIPLGPLTGVGVNLSLKKIRRGATVVGGSLLGLGIAAALATPALACNSSIKPDVSCLNADGTWSVTWSVTSDLQNRTGTITAVDITPAGAPLTNIVVGTKD